MQAKRSNSKFFLGITVAFLLPLSFFIVAKILGKDKLAMPKHYNPERVDSSLVDGKYVYDTVYHKVGNVSLVNQMGDTVSINNDLPNKVLIVGVFFTKCTSICPQLSGNMTILQKAFRKNDSTVQLISISIDPENDSVVAIKEYANRYLANPDHWWFLTGNRTAIYEYLHNELKLKINPSDAGAEMLDHTPTLVLIDKHRFIRGYYNGLDTLALRTCANDIGLISMEKSKKVKE
jgi:protein SCO1/2